MFNDPRDGVYHNPPNCYVANGWKQVTDTTEKVPVADGMTVPVSLITWEKGDERVVVAYWYQLGDHILYDRFDLGNVRLKLRGQSAWPVLLKVMAQATLDNPEETQKALLAFAEEVAKWLNQPDHQKYLSRWPNA